MAALLLLVPVPVLVLVGVLCAFGVGFLLLPSVLRWVRSLADLERTRLSWIGDEVVGPGELPRSLRAALADATLRRELAWLVPHATLGLAMPIVGLRLIVYAVQYATAAAWWQRAPDELVSVQIWWWSVFAVNDWTGVWTLSLFGPLCALAAVLLVPAMAWVQALPGRRLLGPPPGTDLSVRVVELTGIRAAILDAHAVELRRIELSLHDGSQNRLVTVTVLLGAARRARVRDPARAEALLERAQSAAELALVELREVVRSVLPPVLADRGFAVALNGLAADCAVPCRVEVELAGRLAASAEAAAYFVVAEALTNTARHSGATGVSVSVRRRGARIRGPGGRRFGAGRHPPPGASPGRDHYRDQPARRAHHRGRGADVRIVIAEDDAMLREGLALLLRAEDLEVVGTAASGEELLAVVAERTPELAVIDVRMPPTHTDEGIRAAVQSRQRQSGLAVLVLSAHVEQAFATELLTSGSAGLGYLLKERVGRVVEFVEAPHRVVSGGTAIDPEVVAQLLTHARPDTGLERTSPREREVLALMAQGLGNTAIARRHFVSDGAVPRLRRPAPPRRRAPATVRSVGARRRQPGSSAAAVVTTCTAKNGR